MRIRVMGVALAGLVGCGGVPPDLDALNDIVPPRILTVSPADGTDNVSTSSVVTVLFSEPVDPATVTTQTFFLTGDQGPVGAELSVEGALATLRPVVPLQAATPHRATVRTLILDAAGNALVDGRQWTFTTGQGLFSVR